MDVSWTRIRHAVTAALALLFFGLFVVVGLTAGGWGPIEGAVVGAVLAGALVLKGLDDLLTTPQEGVLLGCLVVLGFGPVLWDAHASGERPATDTLLAFAGGLVAAAGFVAWPWLEDAVWPRVRDALWPRPPGDGGPE
ncbi:hypothetical protein [Halomicrobium salinisoli]|uniref:hypothetical protein n=1 Tax=Halomicrobium salinisoli TaxID=2878391 RepID=UPI001CEFB47F|nr:hypothetical protein [Halomicrobium salinisoli]